MAKLSIEDSNASRFSAFALTLAAADRRNKSPETTRRSTCGAHAFSLEEVPGIGEVREKS